METTEQQLKAYQKAHETRLQVEKRRYAAAKAAMPEYRRMYESLSQQAEEILNNAASQVE